MIQILKKINFDLFDILKEYPIASAYMYNRYTDRVRDTRIGLWKFYKEYLKNLIMFQKT